MDNSVIITIIILIALSMLFLLVAINTQKKTAKKKIKILKNLQDLKIGAYSSNPSERITAIIKLDNLLAKALQYRFSNEKNCGENLKMARKFFSRPIYEKIWEIHKLRNQVVHDDMSITEEKMQDAYKIYNLSINKIKKLKRFFLLLPYSFSLLIFLRKRKLQHNKVTSILI